ncbi:MAG: hypothetical protein V3U54_07660 [Thermodesulfobacteriota bacterium]
MKKVLELLEINDGLYIVPEEIAEITIIKDGKVFGPQHLGHTLITLKNGNSHIAPLALLKLFQNWSISGQGSGFEGVDIYTIYKDEEELKAELKTDSKE